MMMMIMIIIVLKMIVMTMRTIISKLFAKLIMIITHDDADNDNSNNDKIKLIQL